MMIDDGRVHWSKPSEYRKHLEHQILVAEAVRYWSQPCQCGSGLAAANCRCRVKAMEQKCNQST